MAVLSGFTPKPAVLLIIFFSTTAHVPLGRTMMIGQNAVLSGAIYAYS
jgi:hypothetical protein